MNRICKILCAVILARLLLSFLWATVAKDEVYCATENRTLREKPSITASGLLDGSYYRELELYYADAYPNRENVLEDFDWLKDIYGIKNEK